MKARYSRVNKQIHKPEKTRQQMLDLLDGDREMLESLLNEELSELTADTTPPVRKTSRFLVFPYLQKHWSLAEEKQKEAYPSRYPEAHQEWSRYHLQSNTIEESPLY